MLPEIHSIPLRGSSFQIAEQLRHVLDEAAAGIWRSRNAIARTTSCLEVAQQFLVQAGPWLRLSRDAARARHTPASLAFGDELSRLRLLLQQLEVRVDGERTDLGMEAAELDRLRVELRRASSAAQSQEVSE